MKLDKGDQAPACGFFEEPSFLKLHHSNCDMRVKEKRHGQNYKKTIPFHGPFLGSWNNPRPKPILTWPKKEFQNLNRRRMIHREVEPGPSATPRHRYRRKGPEIDQGDDPKCAKQISRRS
jgi:hypothetical protein